MVRSFHRRVFLGATGAVGLGALLDARSLFPHLGTHDGGARSTCLVTMFLRGGVDGLGLCPPYGESEYYRLRPLISLPPPGEGNRSLIDLDGFFGLHPALSPLWPLYSEGRLAVVHAVGNDQLTRSHFDAQEFVETGTPGVKGTTSGWLSRSLKQITDAELTRALSFSNLLPRALLGPQPTLVVNDLAQFDFLAAGWRTEAAQLLAELYGGDPGAVGQAGLEGLEGVVVVKGTDGIGSPPSNGAVYPPGSVGDSLRQAAQVVRSELGTRCIFVDVERSFDTHSVQLPSNDRDFRELAAALFAFDTDLGSRMDDVVVLVFSEFGRMVRENGAGGTDHGTAGAMLVLGGRVRGGRVHGTWPGLMEHQLHEGRDLAVTTDYRDVFNEIAVRHLGVADSGTLFPGLERRPFLGIYDAQGLDSEGGSRGDRDRSPSG